MSTAYIGLGPITVKVALATNLTLSGLQTIDGVSCIAGDLVLAMGQTDGTQNGPYLLQSGAWIRVISLTSGQYFTVLQGTTNAGNLFELTTLSFSIDPITGVCTIPLNFVAKTGGGGGGGPITLTGDDVGASNANTVVKLQNRPISTAAPTSGQVLEWDGIAWTPATVSSGSVTLAGDATGPSGANTVVKLQTRPVSNAAPSAGQILLWNGSSWTPSLLSVTASNVSYSPTDASKWNPAPTQVGQALDELANSMVSTAPTLYPSSGDDYFFGQGTVSQYLADWQTPLTTFNLLAGPVDRGATFTTPTNSASVSTTKRPGWILFQPSADMNFIPIGTRALANPPGTPTNVFLYTQFSMDSNMTPTSSPGDFFAMAFCNSLGGDMDANNMVMVGVLRGNGNQWDVAMYLVEAGSGNAVGGATVVTSNTCPFTRIGIQKIGNVYRAFASMDGFSWIQVIETTSTVINPDRVAYNIGCSQTPNTIFGIHEFRRLQDATI